MSFEPELGAEVDVKQRARNRNYRYLLFLFQAELTRPAPSGLANTRTRVCAFAGHGARWRSTAMISRFSAGKSGVKRSGLGAIAR